MQRIFDAFERAGKELFLVGGAVRELALGVPIEAIDDLDFCTDALPKESLAILRGAGFTTYEAGIDFGTVGAVLYHDEAPGYPKDCQITTYRSHESYRRGSRHPIVRYGTTLLQDLKRRDFSINSIAMSASGEYVDPYDGRSDLARGVLRVVGDPHETLAEDPLRILRVGRFVAKLGFEADEALREACRDRAPCIMEISRERWLQEMSKLLVAPHAPAGLMLLHEVGILKIILPEVTALVGLHTSSPVHHKDMWAHTLQVVEQAERDVAQRWGALLHDIGKALTRQVDEASGTVSFHQHEEVGAALIPQIAERFRFDAKLAQQVHAITALHGRVSRYEPSWSDSAVRRLVRELDPHADEVLRFGRADLTTGVALRREEALERHDDLMRRVEALAAQDALRPALPSGIGQAIMDAFGLAPSPQVGALKQRLEEQILEGAIANGLDAAAYIDHLQALIAHDDSSQR